MSELSSFTNEKKISHNGGSYCCVWNSNALFFLRMKAMTESLHSIKRL